MTLVDKMSLKIVLTLVCALSSIGSAFVIQSGLGNNTLPQQGFASSDQTLHNLLTLLAEEKQLRLQLENRLHAAEITWNQYNAEVTKELQKERNNRQQLFSMVSTIETKLQNLTIESKSEKQDTKTLAERYTNISQIVQDIKGDTMDTQKVLTYLNSTVLMVTGGQEHTAKYQANVIDELRESKGERQMLRQNVSNLTKEIENVNTELSSINAHYNTLLWEIAILKQQVVNVSAEATKPGVKVGFSVNDPYGYTGNGINPLTFKTTIYNHDNAFDMSSGIFVCKEPGLYYFNHEINRYPDVQYVKCYLCKNGIRLSDFSYSYAGNADMKDYPSGSTSAVNHLNKGDQVYVSQCNRPDKLGATTSFTGFLVSAD